ncbi:6,7-dimethyl-8-ribityllumazine synthase [Verrucomicrobiota bacterium sgz303538]
MATVLPSRPRSGGPRRAYAIVASQYHSAYVDGLVDHFRQELEAISPGSSSEVYNVPGAFEVPLAVEELARSGRYDAIVAFGVIIEGQTAHAALIGSAVTDALMRIILNHRVPVVHEVLLVRTEEQARARCIEGELNRGTEAARVAVRMVQTMAEIRR